MSIKIDGGATNRQLPLPVPRHHRAKPLVESSFRTNVRTAADGEWSTPLAILVAVVPNRSAKDRAAVRCTVHWQRAAKIFHWDWSGTIYRPAQFGTSAWRLLFAKPALRLKKHRRR